MNIFLTSTDPNFCAHQLDDKRVNNQIREMGQMLATALRKNGYEGDDIPKVAHPNHPVTKWVMETRGNYIWALTHFYALCAEKHVRFPKGKAHAYEEFYNLFRAHRKLVPAGPQLPFVNCARNKELGLDFTDIEDVHLAYKRYMIARWISDKTKPKFSNRAGPDFFLYAMEKRDAES